MHTRTLHIHTHDNSAGRWHQTLFGTTHCLAAPYLTVSMSSTQLRALCLFRLGKAQLNVHVGGWQTDPTPVFGRICAYCKHVCGQDALEDGYHVAVECPLYEHFRTPTYGDLRAHGFDFSVAHNLQAVFTSLMSSGQPSAARITARFLADCMAVRDVHLGRAKTSTWVPRTTMVRATECIDAAPTTSTASLAILRQANPHCDTSLCPPLAQHAQHFWFI